MTKARPKVIRETPVIEETQHNASETRQYVEMPQEQLSSQPPPTTIQTVQAPATPKPSAVSTNANISQSVQPPAAPKKLTAAEKRKEAAKKKQQQERIAKMKEAREKKQQEKEAALEAKLEAKILERLKKASTQSKPQASLRPVKTVSFTQEESSDGDDDDDDDEQQISVLPKGRKRQYYEEDSDESEDDDGESDHEGAESEEDDFTHSYNDRLMRIKSQIFGGGRARYY